MRPPLALGALAAALVAAPAHAATREVAMPGKFFEPPNLTLLVGDTVTWANKDIFAHDVADLAGTFSSGQMAPGARFSVTFTRPGLVPYRCTIHPFMTGSIDVFSFQLLGPARPVAVRQRAVLRGLAPGGVHTVTIEQRRPDGAWAAVGSGPVGADGAFRVAIVPAGPGVYRATAGGNPSLPLRLPVSAALNTDARRLKGGRVALRTVARPGQRGAPAALQLYSREHYRWRQVAHGRLDGRSAVSFVLRLTRRMRARVVLLKGTRGYAPGTGPERRFGP